MTARFEQPGRLPSTPEELEAYLSRRRERLLVEGEAHRRAADAIETLRNERGTSAEGDDLLRRLVEEHRSAASRAFSSRTMHTTREDGGSDDGSGGAVA